MTYIDYTGPHKFIDLNMNTYSFGHDFHMILKRELIGMTNINVCRL